MHEPSQQTRRFVSAVRRRMVMLRLLESAGVGMLLGCAAGLVFSLVLLWRGGGAIGLATGCVVGGALIGLAWGLSRRPTIVQAAMEADRQLGLQDLLLTAVSVDAERDEANLGVGALAGGELPPSPRPSLEGRGVNAERNEAIDPFAMAVVSMAAQRCLAHSPSELVMHRLGFRAWGGIGLAAALVFAVAGLATQAEQGRAESGRQAFLDPRAIDQAERRNEPIERTGVSRQADHAGGRDNDYRDGPQPLLPTPVDEGADPTMVDAGDTGQPSPAGDDAAGSGLARSDVDQHGARPFYMDGTEGREADMQGQVRSGSGRPDEAATDPESADPTGQTVTADRSLPESPAWRSDSPSPADREAALQAVREGQVPDPYRDLVRDYFAPGE